MHTIRLPAVAGTFYPGDSPSLASTVVGLLAQARAELPRATPSPPPKALIVPHAGYIYSGLIAARAYAQLDGLRHQIRRVVLLGPVHHFALRGLALPGVSAFRTPLGELPVDSQAVAELSALQQVTVSAGAHAMEHSLEVQLPFLQMVLDDFELLPLAVGDATPQEVAQVLEALWGGPETLFVVSSDLSHYMSYASAQQADSQTVSRILSLDATLTHTQACGGTPLNGLLLTARRHDLQARLLGLCNSGDTAGDRQRVVGYAAIAFSEPRHAAH